MEFQCGYIAVVGRPNVGKSTLINRILGQKLNITSRKPQTTRYNLLGIKTEANFQAMYVDTPGLHTSQKKAINRVMNRTAESVVYDVDVLVFVVDALVWTDEDEHALSRLQYAECPVILAINKIDNVPNKSDLLPFIEKLSEKRQFSDIVPIVAIKGAGVEQLENIIQGYLPEAPPFYDEDQLTDKSERFLVAEIVREKIMRQTGDEIPYSVTMEIESFVEDEKLITIHALILVERDSQKSIIIGKQGSRLKLVGSEARKDIEKLLDKKVFLKLWVRVKQNWSDDERALSSLGYGPEKE
ncbi:MAG: GTPase Era [Sinobacterium sp.]|nr:GTPase Era [Sinobacterium sp.]